MLVEKSEVKPCPACGSNETVKIAPQEFTDNVERKDSLDKDLSMYSTLAKSDDRSWEMRRKFVVCANCGNIYMRYEDLKKVEVTGPEPPHIERGGEPK